MVMKDSKKEQKKEGERLAKRLARAGIASRRDAEKMIAEGRVKLNGKVQTSPAINVTEADEILVNGKPLKKKESTRLWIYHKPPGLVTSHKDDKGRPTVFDSLPKDMARVISVGRLDLNSEGLLLLTNNGELSRYLELPSTGWSRTYRVRALGHVTQEKLDRLKNGLRVNGIQYGPIDARLEGASATAKSANNWMTMNLTEGKNREIRNVLEFLGLSVNRLIRIAYGPFTLDNIEREEVIEVHPKDISKYIGKEFD